MDTEKLDAAVPQHGWLIEQLRDPETAAAYLAAAFAEGDLGSLMLASKNLEQALIVPRG